MGKRKNKKRPVLDFQQLGVGGIGIKEMESLQIQIPIFEEESGGMR